MKALTYFRKRGLALFLALAMCLTVLPGVALAEGEIDLEPVLEGEQTDAAPAPAPQSDEQTESGTIRVYLTPNSAAIQDEKEGWGVQGNKYYHLGNICVTDTSVLSSISSNSTGVTFDQSSQENKAKLESLLSGISFNGDNRTINIETVEAVKFSKQGDSTWNLDIKFKNENQAREESPVYVYMDTTLGADVTWDNLQGLTDSQKELLKEFPKLWGEWATLGKIERINLNGKTPAEVAAEIKDQSANFTAFAGYTDDQKAALFSLLESLTWDMKNVSGANYGDGYGGYAPGNTPTKHLDGTINYFQVSYANEIDGELGADLASVPVLMNKSISEFQNTLEGYTFGGWFLPNGDPFTPGVTKITADTQLIARWTSPTPEEPEIFIPIEFPDDIAPTPGTTTTIEDEETPLAGSVGLNNTDHFAYIEGYNDGTVRPLDNMTRAEAVTIFFRLMDDEYRLANWSTENSYTDVNTGDWYNNAVSTCANAGILDAFTGSEFLPNQPITRAEFAVIAAGFAGEEFTGESVGDFDDTAGHWAAAEIRKAAEAGWVHGDKGNFNPDEFINRAEVVTLVNNMLDRIPDAEHMLPEMKTFSDNIEGEWYYEAIQEAANGHEYERDELGVVETWTELQAERDWAALEAEWAAAAAAEEE